MSALFSCNGEEALCQRFENPLSETELVPHLEISVEDFLNAIPRSHEGIEIAWSEDENPLIDFSPEGRSTTLSYQLEVAADSGVRNVFEKNFAGSDRSTCPPEFVRFSGTLTFTSADGAFDEQWTVYPTVLVGDGGAPSLRALVGIEQHDRLSGTFRASLRNSKWDGATWKEPQTSIILAWTEDETSGKIVTASVAIEVVDPHTGATEGRIVDQSIAVWSSSR